ncbi:MAG TPA: SMI1/KNR4 family protein [Chloroflexia bacterium]|jgi:hypothetical protein
MPRQNGAHDEREANNVLPPFDFSEPLGLTVMQRMERAVGTVKARHEATEYDKYNNYPSVPPLGATDLELTELQHQLGVEFPAEYTEFLRHWRYVDIGTGLNIYGLDYADFHPTAPVWVSDEHMEGSSCLVIADCFQYADGDQLLVPIHGRMGQEAVLLYLHEDGPKFEVFAPSFSLALWRLVFEDLEDDEWE